MYIITLSTFSSFAFYWDCYVNNIANSKFHDFKNHYLDHCCILT